MATKGRTVARTTLRQVAEAVGLHVSTVSRILNRPECAKASDETRERVLAVAGDLDYQANAVARALVKGRVGSIGVLVPDYLDPVYMQYVEELARLFEAEGSLLAPMVTHFGAEAEQRALTVLNSGRVDAVIALRYEPENGVFYRHISERGLPLVFRLPEDVGRIPFDAVVLDISEGFGVLADHFAKSGRRRIGLLGGFAATELAHGQSASLSVRRFLASCRAHGLNAGPESAVPCRPQAKAAHDALLGRFGVGGVPPYDAIVVQSNRLLPGVCSGLRQLGVRVPEDVELGVISDSEFCRAADIPIVVWAQPVSRICAELFRLTRDRLSVCSRPPCRVRVQSRLIFRETGDHRNGQQ